MKLSFGASAPPPDPTTGHRIVLFTKAAAYALTSAYDSAVSTWMAGEASEGAEGDGGSMVDGLHSSQ